MLPEALETARLLEEQGLSARVASFHTVKPLDGDYLADAFARFPLVATVEEHSLIGGFGSAVAEWTADHAVKPRAFLRFGTPDAFFKQSGEQEYAREQLGLSAHHIAGAIRAALQ
jgi:transketolase